MSTIDLLMIYNGKMSSYELEVAPNAFSVACAAGLVCTKAATDTNRKRKITQFDNLKVLLYRLSKFTEGVQIALERTNARSLGKNKPHYLAASEGLC